MANVGTLGFFSKARLNIVFAFAMYALLSVVISVINGIIVYQENGEIAPLLHSTVGKIVGADETIRQDVELLNNPSFDSKLAEFLRDDILNSLVLIIIFISLIYWVLSKIFMIFESEATMNFGKKLLIFAFALFIFTMVSKLYIGFYFDDWSINPFKGLANLITNYSAVFSNAGVESSLGLVATNITNITGGY